MNIFMGFKGKNNNSSIIAQALAENYGHCLLLTNSFYGVQKDIENIAGVYQAAFLFGIDKTLRNEIRIETIAQKNSENFRTKIDFQKLSGRFEAAGILCTISDSPTFYLCNEAYWYALQKFKGNAILIHIPTIKNGDENFAENIKKAFA